MNMQTRADIRSAALHRLIARKLRSNPDLWRIPKENIDRWKTSGAGLQPAIREWEQLLASRSPDQILSLIEGDSEESIRLRSSSPFTGILTEREREMIFQAHRMRKFRNP